MVGYRYPVLPENLTLPLRRCALSDRRPYSTYCYVNAAVTIIISCHGSRRVGPPMPNCKRPLSIAGATHSLQWSEDWNSQEIQQRLDGCEFYVRFFAFFIFCVIDAHPTSSQAADARRFHVVERATMKQKQFSTHTTTAQH